MNTADLTDTASRLRRAVTQTNRRLRQSSLGGISPAQASMLASIDKAGNPSLGDLATLEQIQPPSVTRLVNMLVAQGLIVRTVDPSDRRCQRVTLTASGRKEIARIRQRKTEFLERRLQELSPADQQRAADLVTLLEHLLGDGA